MRDYVDEKIAVAMHDLIVPEGLGQRLLAILATTENEKLAASDEPVATPRSSLHKSRLSRRWMLTVGGLAATAAGLLVAVWLGIQQGDTLSEQFVIDEAIRFFESDTGQVGYLAAEKSAPAGYPISLAVMQVRGTRWRTLTEPFLGRRGVVYNLPGPTGTSAALYVMDSTGTEELDVAPAMHPFTTAGCSASSWREGRLLYVLVVQGDPTMYRAYLNLPKGPVA